MAEEEGATTNEGHERYKPWEKRTTILPKRTWTGSIVYKKPKHTWNMKDVERIIAHMEVVEEFPPQDWVQKFLLKIKDLTLMLLEKIIPFLDSQDIRALYDWVYELLGKIFGVDTDYMLSNRSSGEALIYAIAAKFKLDVTIKRL